MNVDTRSDYRNDPDAGCTPWTATVAGAHALAWQQAQIDQWVADVFGYHAVQLGMPELEALRHNRMPHRWLLCPAVTECPPRSGAPLQQVCAEFHALPFGANSLDLLVMPHTLEACTDAHLTLREAERVLRPEGRLVITGFNPASAWGAVGRMRRLSRRGSPEAFDGSVLAGVPDWVGYWRLRDWLHLLGFEVEGGRFGCYSLPVGSPSWLQRLRWMESLGDRWWPVLGGLYAVMAIKRVRGVRLLGLSRRAKAAKANSRAVVTQGQRRQSEGS